MKSRALLIIVIGTFLCLVVIGLSPRYTAEAQQGDGTTTRISIPIPGMLISAEDSVGPAISADGRFVAFSSSSYSLVPWDTNGQRDVFVHDRQTGATTRVSVSSSGRQGNYQSNSAEISADGRFVVFTSLASTLVTGDSNLVEDIFVHDRLTGATTCVSVDSSGAQGNHHSYSPTISADGRFVAFTSYASNLVPGDTNAKEDIFVHDRQTRETTRVSVDSSGEQGNDYSRLSTLSADGRYMAFSSAASNLVPGDSNAVEDAFVHDRLTGTTTRISVDSYGAQGNSISYVPEISADSRFVAFFSLASNLVAGDTNDVWDIFVHDRNTETTTRVSVDSSGAQSFKHSNNPSISANGRFVSFSSAASNLVPGDTNGTADIFIHDRQTGTTTRISVDSYGAQGNSSSSVSAISADGRIVAFESRASNLVMWDTNAASDIFVHQRSGSVLGDNTSPDYIIDNIEVTQAIQDRDNSVPLIAGKKTYARVHVRNVGVPSDLPVTAELCYQGDCRLPDNKVEGLPDGYIRVLNNPNRSSYDDSFYFLLDKDWVDTPGELVLTSIVNGKLNVRETYYVNNFFTSKIMIVPSYPLRLKIFNVSYDLGFLDGNRIYQIPSNRRDREMIKSWLMRAYPISEKDLHYIKFEDFKLKPSLHKQEVRGNNSMIILGELSEKYNLDRESSYDSGFEHEILNTIYYVYS